MIIHTRINLLPFITAECIQKTLEKTQYGRFDQRTLQFCLYQRMAILKGMTITEEYQGMADKKKFEKKPYLNLL